MCGYILKRGPSSRVSFKDDSRATAILWRCLKRRRRRMLIVQSAGSSLDMPVLFAAMLWLQLTVSSGRATVSDSFSTSVLASSSAVLDSGWCHRMIYIAHEELEYAVDAGRDSDQAVYDRAQITGSHRASTCCIQYTQRAKRHIYHAVNNNSNTVHHYIE